MKHCVMCARDKEDVVLVNVTPATWNAFNDFTEVCAECRESRRFKMWAKTAVAKARKNVPAGGGLQTAVLSPSPAASQLQISHRQTGALLHTVESASLQGAALGGAQLSGAALQDAKMRGADLLRADLHLADLAGADLRGADLRAANVRGADLRGTDLREARLAHADLHFCLYDQRTLWPAGFDPRTSGAQSAPRRG